MSNLRARLLALPRPVFEALRSARTIVLWLLGPLEALARLEKVRGGRPPLWLRRHTGPVSHFESAAREMTQLLETLGLVAPDDLVLDAGCGVGAMVPTFARLLGPSGRYVGFDLHEPSIRWCRSRFRADPRLGFETTNPGTASRFPVADGEAGFVLAKSLFTHLQEPEARHFLSEIRRVLRPGGTAVVTAFLFERGEGETRASEFFPFASADGSARSRWRAHPESAIAFESSRFLALVSGAGLSYEWLGKGFWPGAAVPRGQDVLLLFRAGTSPASRAAPKTP